MIVLLSPAKTLDFESDLSTKEFSHSSFMDESQHLNKVLKGLKPQDLRKLMGISEKLADLNHERNLSWKIPFTNKNARPAALAFKGDVYLGLESETLNKRDWTFAQKHIRILSGLYGILKPLDLIQAYRLEMGTRLKVSKDISNLYQFWDDKITKSINQELSTVKKPVVVNLASNEYYKVVQAKNLQANIITPAFKDWKNGQYKMISFFAKKARGMMARYIIDKRVKTAKDLLGFDYQGYEYNHEMSEENKPVFTRLQIPS